MVSARKQTTGEDIRQAVRKSLEAYPTKNKKIAPQDRFLALLYIEGFKVVSTENS